MLELTDAEGVEAEIQSADEYKDNIYSAMVGIDELNLKFKLPTVVSGSPSPVELARIAAPPVTECDSHQTSEANYTPL